MEWAHRQPAPRVDLVNAALRGRVPLPRTDHSGWPARRDLRYSPQCHQPRIAAISSWSIDAEPPRSLRWSYHGSVAVRARAAFEIAKRRTLYTTRCCKCCEKLPRPHRVFVFWCSLCCGSAACFFVGSSSCLLKWCTACAACGQTKT